MLAKLIVYGETREAARRRAVTALRDFAIDGITTNIGLLVQILEHEQFVNASIDTGFLDRELPALVAAIPAIDRDDAEPPARHAAGGPAALDPFVSLKGWRLDGRVAWAATATGDRAARQRTRNDSGVMSPMPATVVSINAAAGQTVKEGDTLIVLEAMKMELPIKSPRSGVIKAVHCAKGDLVQPGISLIEIE
jgi:acetyl/propionyl-CoA carboxylase alpha subunit